MGLKACIPWTPGVQQKMWVKISPSGEGKDPIPLLSPRERGRSQRPDRRVQRKMWDTLSPKGEGQYQREAGAIEKDLALGPPAARAGAR